MAGIIITLTKNDIGNLLLGEELYIIPSVHKFDNLTNIVLRFDEYSCNNTAEEVNYDD